MYGKIGLLCQKCQLVFDVNEVSSEFIVLEKDQVPANISGK